MAPIWHSEDKDFLLIGLWHSEKKTVCITRHYLSSGKRSFTKGYRQPSNIIRTLIGNKIVDDSDEVGASPVGTAPATSSFSTKHLALMEWVNITARRDDKHLAFGDLVRLTLRDLTASYGQIHGGLMLWFIHSNSCSMQNISNIFPIL